MSIKGKQRTSIHALWYRIFGRPMPSNLQVAFGKLNTDELITLRVWLEHFEQYGKRSPK